MVSFTPKQIILLVVIVSVVVSVASALGTVVFVLGESPSSLVARLETIGSGNGEAAQRLINEKILRQDELVVAVVKAASPGVVSIVASKDVPVIEQYYIDPFGGDPFFQQFFGDGGGVQVPQYRQKGTERRDVSSGSGFVVSSDGLILTNKHVVSDKAAEYTVFLNDGTKLPAKVLARDPYEDLAVLKVTPPAAGLKILPLGDSASVQAGQSVIAIGNALGEFRNTVSVGIVSGLQRSVTAGGGGTSETLQELIQTDAAINPGNSGGPLLNIRGEVIGINTAMAQGAQNIGFSIPINKAKRDITTVKTQGRIIYPFIGIRYLTITKDIQEKNKLATDYGAWVTKSSDGPAIVAGSPAEKAGIRDGDIIVKVNGNRVDMSHTLGSYLFDRMVGDTVVLSLYRDGKEFDVSVVLEERK